MILAMLRHRSERNEVYTITMPGRVYRVIGDLHQPVTMYRYEKTIDTFQQADYAKTFLEGNHDTT